MKKHRNHLKLLSTFFIIISLLIVLGSCQRGRGGSSSSSSFGSRSYSSGYHSGYGYGGYGRGGAGSVIGSIFGGLCGLGACCGLCYYCCQRNGTAANLTGGFNNNQNAINQDNPMALEQEFQNLKMRKNNVSPNTMSFQQFQRIKSEFLSIFNNPSSFFTYTQAGQTTRIQDKRVHSTLENQFLQRLEFNGNDEVGAWIGRGYFMVTPNGPYVWWMKDYKDKYSAGQYGDSKFLIYESTSYNPGYWTGKWYFQGDQYDPEYSGNWSLQGQGNISSANPFNLIANKIHQYN